MKFRTEIEINSYVSQIDYRSTLLTLGSCFAGEVGARLLESKFQATVNPTGVLFNPSSICRAVERFANREIVTAEELTQTTQGWCHYDFHSSLSDLDARQCVQKINRAVECGHRALHDSDWVILTLGTAWVYELRETSRVVASCHKQPHAIFHRRRLSVAEVVEAISYTIDKYLSNKKIVLTLSPIRHLGDGLSENSVSKSTLRVALDELASMYPTQVHYFPAYEILLDDLRDYRFYGEDMAHPTPVAVDYVWEKFRATAIHSSALPIMTKVEKIVRATHHRPLNPTSENYKLFCKNSLHEISQLENIVDMTREKEYFEQYL